MTPLRQRMIDDMQLRNFAPATQRNYIHYVAEFAKYFRLSPEHLDLEAVRQYQLHLVNERKLSPQSVNQYVSAVKFLYTVTLDMPWSDDSFVRARCPNKLPLVLSHEELMQFFDYVPSLKYRAALMICYGAGLRISEVVALKIDIGYRFSAHVDSRRAGQRTQGSLCHVVPTPSGSAAPVLARHSSPAVALSVLASHPSPVHGFFTGRLPGRRSPLRTAQEGDRPYLEALFRHSPVGKRHGSPCHPGAAGA
jgi:hypothetical protein